MLLLGLYPLPFPVLPSTVNREPSRLVAASPLSLRLVTAVLLACWPTCSSRSHGFFPFAKTHCKGLLLQGGSCVSQHFPDLCVRVTWRPGPADGPAAPRTPVGRSGSEHVHLSCWCHCCSGTRRFENHWFNAWFAAGGGGLRRQVSRAVLSF